MKKTRPRSADELLDKIESFAEADEIAQPKGEVRICTRDGSELRVVMIVGLGEDGGDVVYMVCDVCGAKYSEQADFGS